MTVTDVTYVREDESWIVWTIPSEDYRPGMTEPEAAAVALRFKEGASAPGARGVEGRAQLNYTELDRWQPQG